MPGNFHLYLNFGIVQSLVFVTMRLACCLWRNRCQTHPGLCGLCKCGGSVSTGVLPHYTLCSEEPAWQVKTIANTYYLQSLATHPHNFIFRCSNTAKLSLLALP